jgi:hypothetical protein
LDEKLTYEELEQRVMQLEKDNSEFKRLEESLKNRIVALTLPQTIQDFLEIRLTGMAALS